MQANRESAFKTVLAAQNFSAQDSFLQALNANLRAQGYTVKMIQANRDEADFLGTYPADGTGSVDAYLDLVTLGYGYVAAGIKDSTPYRPYCSVKAKLVHAKNASVLMQDVVIYNPINTPKDSISIAPDPAYQFVDFDTLTGDPTKATAGLKLAVEKTASTISSLLK